MRKAGLFATFVLATAAILAAFATTGYASSGQTAPCDGCHYGTGVTVTATLAGTSGANATYDVAVTGGTEWAVFDGTTRVSRGDGTTGQFTVAAGKVYNVYAVNGLTDGLGQTTVSPPAPPASDVDTSKPDTTLPVTTSDALDSYVGATTIHVTATDNVGGWGIAYIYSRVGDQPISLTRVLAGIRISTASFTLAAPASGTTTYRVSYWAQDNYGNVEARTFKNIAVASVAVVPPVKSGIMPVYRFYNLRSDTHFYTSSEAEKNTVLATLGMVYRLDGPAYSINTLNPANSVPLYRFYNMKTGTHFYTASESEKNSVLANLATVYRLEGVAYNVCMTPPAGSTTVYRFYNMKTGTHFYTADPVEKANVLNNMKATYSLDGPAFFLAP